MKILILEGYFGGSHREWIQGLLKYSTHSIQVLALPARHWKWRMHGGAITLAQQFLKSSSQPDLIVATDMIDLSVFLAMTRSRTVGVPTILYFHENQLTYPTQGNPTSSKSRDLHYGFINYHNALTANRVVFNSIFHRSSFLGALSEFLDAYPDYQNLETIEDIKEKSSVLPVGIDVEEIEKYKPLEKNTNQVPHILWNHRWEYDKNPEQFFEALFKIESQCIDFRLIVLGKNARKYPAVFDQANKKLSDQIVQFGHTSDKSEYYHWLWMADVLPVTSRQDFFGISVVEAMACSVQPILPKRLAYPEHVPETHHREVFYSTTEELEKLLTTSIKDRVPTNDTELWVRKYDWRKLIKKYDEYFEK